jgi:pSer/pThr/pTyr-binding forkhead associated (FHA) protein
MGKLVLHKPDGTTRDFPLTRERMTIGRRVDNDICLPYPAVSGEHAAVVTILDDSFLEDLNSTNGTLVNGKSISKHFLRDLDEIDVGRHKLVYYAGDDSQEAASSALVDLEAALGEKSSRPRVPSAPVAPNPLERVEPPVAAGVQRVEHGPSSKSVSALNAEVTLPLRSPDGGTIDTAALFDAPRSPEPHRGAPAGREAPADAPTLRVLDGPSAGREFQLGREDFVIGCVEVQVATIRRGPDGYRLLHVEGEALPLLNGSALPEGGAVLGLGDTIEIAGTRIRYVAAA